MRLEDRARAKINLSLDVLFKRDDGYHQVDLIMQELEFSDRLVVEKTSKEGFKLIVNGHLLKDPKDNLIYWAWKELRSFYRLDPSVNIYLDKNIPLAAGLGGGSSDFATTVKLLNKLWALGLSRDEMVELSKKYGADIPFFFYGGSYRARGIGQDLEEISSFAGKNIILVNNGEGISSKEAYENLDLDQRAGSMDLVVSHLTSKDVRLYDIMYNKMEKYSMEKIPEIRRIKERLLDLGADIALMSGSGPTVFGVFEDDSSYHQAYRELLGEYKYVIKTRTI